MPSLSEIAVDELYGEPASSLYRAMRKRCAGGIDLSCRPCCIPPRRMPTRFIDSNYGSKRQPTGYALMGGSAYIVRRVRVVVNTAEERSRRVLADVLDE